MIELSLFLIGFGAFSVLYGIILKFFGGNE